MLSVTGSAQFIDDGTALQVEFVIRPHVPIEHERLEKIAKLYSRAGNAELRDGQLILREILVVPQDPTPEATGSESSTQSGSASETTVIDIGEQRALISAPAETGDSSASGGVATAAPSASADGAEELRELGIDATQKPDGIEVKVPGSDADRMENEGGNDLPLETAQ